MLKDISCRWRRIVAVSTAIIALPFALAAAEIDKGDSSPSTPARMAERQNAAEIYRTRCAECHGETADGKGDARAALVAPERHGILRGDRPYDFRNGAQPGHPHGTLEVLTRDQLAAVGDYIRYALAAPLPEGNLERGAKIYRRTCSVCHGDKGNGASWARTTLNPPPFDFTSPKALSLSRLHMVNTVSHGSPNTAMMGFTTQLARGEIVDVVDYIRSTFVVARQPNDALARAPAGHAHVTGPADMAAALPRGLSGDGERGHDLYRTNCTACHGENGDGKGPRAYFMFRKPADFGSPTSRQALNRPHLFSSISDGVVGSEMPAWSKVLTDQQIADVAEYVFAKFVRPAVSAGPAGQQDGTAAKPAEPAASHGQTGHGHDAPDAKEPAVKKK